MEREWHSYRSKDSSSSPTLAQLYMHRHAGLGTDEEWELKNNRLKLFLTHLQRREIQCRVFFSVWNDGTSFVNSSYKE